MCLMKGYLQVIDLLNDFMFATIQLVLATECRLYLGVYWVTVLTFP